MCIKIKYNPEDGWITIETGNHQTFQGYIEDVPPHMRKYVAMAGDDERAARLGYKRETVKVKLKGIENV